MRLLRLPGTIPKPWDALPRQIDLNVCNFPAWAGRFLIQLRVLYHYRNKCQSRPLCTKYKKNDTFYLPYRVKGVAIMTIGAVNRQVDRLLLAWVRGKMSDPVFRLFCEEAGAILNTR